MWVADTAMRALVASGEASGALPASLTVAARYIKSWVDQDNRRYYDVFGFRVSQTVTTMVSYDMPYVTSSCLRSDVR